MPPGATPPGSFPVIIFNHGSNKEQDTDDRCVLADFFAAKRGYILFAPIRRGHNGSTGEYYEDHSLRRVAETCAMIPCSDADEKFWKRYFTMNYLADQSADVVAAIRYVQTLREANGNRVGVMGQSFGGMVTLLFNELPNVIGGDAIGDQSLHVRASVAISPGAQSWTDVNDPADYLQQRLRTAVRQAKRPICFLQPKNDKSRRPTIELSYEAGDAGQRYQATMFGPVPDELIQPCIPESEADPGETTCGDVAHGKFVRDAGQVAIWGPPVVQFLTRMGVKPDPPGSK